MDDAVSQVASLLSLGSPADQEKMQRQLPVVGISILMGILYFEYVFLHCGRLMAYDISGITGALEELCTFHVFTVMLVYCFVKCIRTHPGSIPEGVGYDQTAVEAERQHTEAKQTGARRWCKWCLMYKPDRCHHCRICGTCTLRMDHHCPWVDNCIGFRNHKYFFLLVLYSVVDLWLISFRMFDSVWWSTRTDVNIFLMIAFIFGEALAAFMMVLTTSFFFFHAWLLLKAMTTVEFCEKSLIESRFDSSIYRRSPHMNVCSVLGPKPLFWLLPMSLPLGDGVDFSTDPSGGACTSNSRVRRVCRKPHSAASATETAAPESVAGLPSTA